MVIRALFLIVLLAACGGASDNLATPPAPTWAMIRLSWTQPTLNTDRSALTDIVSYRVMYGTAADVLTKTVTVPSSQLSISIPVPRGRYFIAIAAVNSAGDLGEFSGIVSVDLR